RDRLDYMRLAAYLVDGRPRAAVVASDETLVPVTDLIAGGPSEMLDVLAAGPVLWDRLRTAQRGKPVRDVQLLAPIPRPRRNIFCVGWNYLEHFTEGQGMRGPSDAAQQI